MRICVGIPVVGAVKAEVYHSHLATMISLARNFELVVPTCVDIFPHSKAREHIIKQAIFHDCDYLYFLDSDMLPPPDAALRLLEVMTSSPPGLEIVMTTAHAFRRGYPYTGVWSKKNPDGQGVTQLVVPKDYDGSVDLDSCGLACNMIDLKWVKKNLSEPYFFQGATMLDGKMTEVWEDAWFCRSIKEKDGLILGLPWVRCGHLGEGTVIDDETVDWLRTRFVKQEHAEGPLAQFQVKNEQFSTQKAELVRQS